MSAAAVAAGAMAVESQNIVGHQVNTGTGTFNFIGATFAPIGTDGAGMILSNITANADFEFAGDSITIFNNEGNIVFSAYYVNPELAGENGIAAGWYDAEAYDADETLTCVNNYPIPAGMGFAFNRANATAAVIIPNPLASNE